MSAFFQFAFEMAHDSDIGYISTANNLQVHKKSTTVILLFHPALDDYPTMLSVSTVT